MGKSAPKPPPAPDPNQIIQTQTQSNENAANYQSALNNVNYSGPQGTVTYDQNSPGRWTEYVDLNPTAQAAYDQASLAQYRAAETAGQQLGRVQDVLAQGSLAAPQMQASAPAGPLATSYADGGAIQAGIPWPGPIQPGVGSGYSPFAPGPGSLPVNPYGGGDFAGAANPAAALASANPGGWTRSDPPPGMRFDTSSGWIPAANDGIDTTGAHPGEMYDASKGWVPATGAAVYPPGAGAPADGRSRSDPPPGMRYDTSSGWIPATPYGVDTSGAHPGQMYDPSKGWVSATAQAVYPHGAGAAQPPASGAVNPAIPVGLPPGYGPSDPPSALLSNPVAATQLAEYGQARQLLDPQWRQAGEQQQAQLAAQGLNPNDAAYQNAMQSFGVQENQAYDQAIFNAIGAGAAEQNTLFGQSLGAGQFANSSQLQNYQELMGQAQLNNAAQAQANAQNAAAATFSNQALGQGWQEQYANAQLANQAAQQQFQDAAYAQDLPINEFTALMGNTQVGMPPSAPAQNTQVAPPSVLGAYTLQQNALQNDYLAQLQNQQSGLTGLFNLGSAALKALPFAGP